MEPIIHGEHSEEALVSYLNFLISGKSKGQTAQDTLAAIGRYFMADRVSLFEKDEQTGMGRKTYEWCAEGVSSQKDTLQDISPMYYQMWVEEFRSRGAFTYHRGEDDHPLVNTVIAWHKIKTLMAAPLVLDGEIMGFVGVDDPRIHTEKNILLMVMAVSLYKDVLHRRERAAVERERKAREELQLDHQIISSIAQMYYAIYSIDIPHNLFEEIFSTEKVHQLTGSCGQAYEKIRQIGKAVVSPEYHPAAVRFVDFQTLPDRMADTDTIELTYHAVDGGWHEMRFIAQKRDSEGVLTHALLVTRQVSREKREQLEREQLQVAFEAAQRANEAKTAFLFSMSHDIRTPMNAILGYTRLMKKEMTDPQLLHYQAKIEQAGGFLLALINNVLDMARIESGKMEVEENETSIGDTLAQIAGVYEAAAAEKQIHFSIDSTLQHDHVFCDAVKVKEIYSNLLSNAIKYTPSGGEVRVRISQLPGETDDVVRIKAQVEDTGIGMSQDFLPHIFEAFTRQRNTTMGRIAGTGLGMPIVKKLVDLMKGSITVTSELGKGSCFTVILPHRIADSSFDNHPDAGDSDHAELIRALRGKHILLAQDNELNAEIAIAILQDLGFSVDHAEDGVLCVRKLEQHPAGTYDVVLMDVQMPNMDGYTATETIRKLPDPAKARIPIIAMTANAFDEDRRHAIRVGMNGHVAKPIDVPKLVETLTGVLLEGRTVTQAKGEGFMPAIDRIQEVCNRFRNNDILSLLPGGFFVYEAGERGNLLFANEAACQIWGCKNYDELVAQTGGCFRGMVHPDDYARVDSFIRKQLQEKRTAIDVFTYRIRRKDGQVRWIDDYGHLVKDSEYGDFFYVFVSDATDMRLCNS